MIHFETYHVHIYKLLTRPWTEEQEDASVMSLVDDRELCGLLEVVASMYLERCGPLARDLVVGVDNAVAPELTGYVRPFNNGGLRSGALPLLRDIVAELNGRVERTGEEE